MIETADIRLTALEFEVLKRVRDGIDPWKEAGSSRTHSQALGRLQKKGLIQTDPITARGYVLTDGGRRWFEEA